MSSDATGIPLGKPPVGLVGERINLSGGTRCLPSKERFRIAVLDDYQDVALSLAIGRCWMHERLSPVFNDHLAAPTAVVERLRHSTSSAVSGSGADDRVQSIEALCPKLRMITAPTGPGMPRSISRLAEERPCRSLPYKATLSADYELTWALILAVPAMLVAENTVAARRRMGSSRG